MGNCNQNLSQQGLEFKHNVIKPKKNCNNNQNNITQKKLGAFYIDNPKDRCGINRDMGLHKQHDKKQVVTNHLSNSTIDVDLSVLRHKQQAAKLSLPTLVQKSSNQLSNISQHPKMSIESLIQNFQQTNLDGENCQPIQTSGPNKQSESYILKQQVRMKYTKSQYIDDKLIILPNQQTLIHS